MDYEIFMDVSVVKEETPTLENEEEQSSSNKGPNSITKSYEEHLKSPKIEVPDSIDQDDIDVSVLHEEVDLGVSVIDNEGDYKLPGLVDSVPTGCASSSGVDLTHYNYSCSATSPLAEDGHPSEASLPKKKYKLFEDGHRTNAERSPFRLSYESLTGISESMLNPVVMLTPLVITNSTTKLEQFVCDKCTLKFESKDSLIQHIKNCCIQYHDRASVFSFLHLKKHLKLKLYKNIDLSKHARTHTGANLFACNLCEFNNKRNLKRHLRTHTGEKPFACDFCKNKFSQKNHLKTHLITHTGEKPFACDFCNYKFSQISHLKTHLRTHTGEKPFACDFCEYKCNRKNNLKIHLRTHTGEKPFACDFCEYKCNKKSHLKRHLRTHTGEKPFACDFCELKFSQKGHLKTHLRTHTGEKPFVCDFCEYKCNHKSRLKRHLSTHNREKLFACDFCEYKFNDKRKLKYHSRTHTGF